jgi:hypothetical protein
MQAQERQLALLSGGGASDAWYFSVGCTAAPP